MKNIDKYVFTAIFIAGVGIYSVLSMVNASEQIYECCSETQIESTDDAKKVISDIEDEMVSNVAARYDVIEIYGETNKLLGKNEINGFEYVRDKNGFLSLGNFWNEVHDTDVKPLAVETEHFYESLKKKGINMLYVSFPQKVSDEWTDGYSGIPYDDFSYRNNMFMIQMRKYRIPNLDLTKTLEESGLPYEEMFFKTDHHWTSKAAFLGFQAILDKLDEMGVELDPNGYYRNFDNYKVIHYEDMMLGSSGRSVGQRYAGGRENFDLYYIDDDTEYEFTYGDDKKLYGKATETFIDFNVPEKIEKEPDSIYTLSMYDMYMRGIRPKVRIDNINSQGPKVLMITDSYASPIGTWLAPMCSRLDFLWANRNDDDAIDRYIEENDYDLVIVGLYPNDVNSEFIRFSSSDDN